MTEFDAAAAYACAYAPGSFDTAGDTPVEDRTRVNEARVFFPNWDALTTTALAPTLEQLRVYALGAARLGLQDGEIAADIAVLFKGLPPVRVSTGCRGTRILIEDPAPIG